MAVLKYADVVEKLGKGRSHLLLGNGFSIACDKCFSYSSLFEYAKANGLSSRAAAVFDRLGTNNFEGVMRLLDDGEWLAFHYGLLTGTDRPMKADLDSVKSSLIASVAKTHPDHTHKIATEAKNACIAFLESFHNIFTTNYDILLYWVEMEGLDRLKGRDGFRQDVDGFEDDYLVFSEHVGGDKGLFFIHGALHLYVEHGEVRKHTWSRSGKSLIENVRDGLDAGRYPLFVAEGRAEHKLEQIQRSGYLSYCLGKLERIENAMVTFGLSFGESDDHISDALARNRKLSTLYVGLFGDPDGSANLEVRKHVARLTEHRKKLVEAGRCRDNLTVEFFDSATAPVWRL